MYSVYHMQFMEYINYVCYIQFDKLVKSCIMQQYLDLELTHESDVKPPFIPTNGVDCSSACSLELELGKTQFSTDKLTSVISRRNVGLLCVERLVRSVSIPCSTSRQMICAAVALTPVMFRKRFNCS